MSQLANRNRQIPGGIFFWEPRTRWRSQPGSFSNVTDQMVAHRTANTWLGLPIDRPTVENELDRFCASICEANGWSEYVTGGDPPNPPLPPLPLGQRLANVAEASLPIVEWLASKEEAVSQELANHRASVCAVCPANQKGDLVRFFTLPVSNAIRKAYTVKTGWELSTPYDNQIQICEICMCPLKLMVHVPLEVKLKTLTPEIKSRLVPGCWVTEEENAKANPKAV